MLSVTKVSFGYKEKLVLNSISFFSKKGKLFVYRWGKWFWKKHSSQANFWGNGRL